MVLERKFLLKNINLKINGGDCLGCGGSGSGKTSLGKFVWYRTVIFW